MEFENRFSGSQPNLEASFSEGGFYNGSTLILVNCFVISIFLALGLFPAGRFPAKSGLSANRQSRLA